MQVRQRVVVQNGAPGARPALPPLTGGSRQRHVCQPSRAGSTATGASAKGRGATKQAEQEKVAGAAAGAADQAAAAAAAAATAAIEAAERESLALLEWPALCRQVACFAQTPMGAEVAVGALPVGRSQRESQQLLQQTAEAQQAQLG